MKKFTTILAVTALALSMLFTGCSKSASEDVAVHNSRSGNTETNMPYEEASYVEDYYEYEAGLSDIEYYDGGSNRTVASSSQTNPNVIDTRMLIRRVTMDLETTNYSQVVNDLLSSVESAGGYVETSSGNTVSGHLRSGYYVIRVPANQLDFVISGLSANATVTSSSESTEDVTLQYADTQAMVESLRIEQETLNELLSQADSLETILILQNELTTVRYQIESYESQLRVLENQASLSTLTVTINEVLEETEVEEPHVVTYGEKVADTFEKMLENTKEFFEDLFLEIILIIPGIIVFAVIATAIFVTVKVLLIKRRKKLKKLAADKVDNQSKNDNNNQL
ncbi:MAG: DUF4349 domain-containing protein [Saccharofermentans sp.]|nr:DUF4349 domain-containing protein [Saccharofermentans sp.]